MFKAINFIGTIVPKYCLGLLEAAWIINQSTIFNALHVQTSIFFKVRNSYEPSHNCIPTTIYYILSCRKTSHRKPRKYAWDMWTKLKDRVVFFADTRLKWTEMFSLEPEFEDVGRVNAHMANICFSRTVYQLQLFTLQDCASPE